MFGTCVHMGIELMVFSLANVRIFFQIQKMRQLRLKVTLANHGSGTLPQLFSFLTCHIPFEDLSANIKSNIGLQS